MIHSTNSKRLLGITLISLVTFIAGFAAYDKLNSSEIATVSNDEGSIIFSNDLKEENFFNSCTVLNGETNTSNNKWKYYKWGPNIQYSIYMSDSGEADSYLFIPNVAFESSKSYKISVDAMNDANNDEYKAVLEFGYASNNTIEAYTAINEVTIPSSAYETVSSKTFSVSAGVTYAVLRVHFQKPEGITVGYMGLKAVNLVVSEATDSDDDNGNGGGSGNGDDNTGGDSGYGDPLTSGEGRTLPYAIVPTAEEIEDLTILDNNQDEDDHGTYVCGVWSYNSDEEFLYYLYSLTNSADDYVFLPLLYFDNADKAYEISLDVMAASKNNPEKFEVCIGTTQNPDNLRVVYKSGTVINDEDWEHYVIPVGIEKAGDYYVAVHAISPKDNFRLCVKNISVKQLETSPNVPKAPEDITAVAGAKGALNADITFTMPKTNIAGGELSGDVTVTISSTVDTKDVTAAAGETVTAQIGSVQGTNNITLSAKNSYGEGNAAVVTVYTGVDKPCAPNPVATASSDNMTLVITWEQSEVGLNGGYVDPATVEYTIFRYDSQEKDFDDGTVITGQTKYEYRCAAGSPQHRESFLITAKNLAGQAEGGSSIAGIIGTPYTLPMAENLDRGRETYSPLSVAIPDDSYSAYADFRVYDLATIFETEDRYYEGIKDEHKTAIWGFIRYGDPGKCRFVLPKFSTAGLNEAKLKLNIFINSILPALDLYATAYNQEPVKIGSISSADGQGWTTLAFALPETLGNLDWVEIYFDTEITDIDNQNIFISSYSITNLLANDLALESLKGTDQALSIGEETEYVATVRNEGKNAAAAPDVIFTLYNGSEIVDTEKVSASGTLQPEDAVEYKYTVKATTDNIGEYTLVAEIETADDNNDNNSASIEVNIIVGLNPVVDDLKAIADKGASTVKLTWSKPDIKLSGSEGFEDYQPFEYGRYIGNFKNVDLDGKKTYSYDQCVFDAATLPKAFMVINPDYLNNRLVEENYTPHGGDQYLVAFCPADGSKADDWLISPEVKPGTTVSFYVTTVALNDYSETYEICYSTTGNNPSDFIVLEKLSVSGVNWTGKAVMLPENAKYFAIHYTSADVFGIMFDDILFTPVVNENSVFKYNVYSDGNKIAEEVTETNYLLEGITDFDAKYNVTAVVDGKEYAMSNTAIATEDSSVTNIGANATSIAVDGKDVVIFGYNGCAVAIYTTGGVAVFSTSSAAEETRVSLDNGIYIVRAGKDVTKISIK